jgi:hypothetical protein
MTAVSTITLPKKNPGPGVRIAALNQNPRLSIQPKVFISKLEQTNRPVFTRKSAHFCQNARLSP